MLEQKVHHADYSEYIGRRAVVSVPIPAGGEGKVVYRGSEWIAFCDEVREIPEGATITIAQVQGIKLGVS
jgi:inner membrane protein